MAFSEAEARIRRLAASLIGVRLDLDTFEARLGRLEQGIGSLYLSFGDKYTATFTGSVKGCFSNGFPGAGITIKDHASGVTLGTFTCDGSGNYSGSVSLSSSPQSVDVVATPAGTYAARFAASATSTVSLSSGSNTIATITIAPATNYACICSSLGYVPTPTASTWHLTYAGVNWTLGGGGSGVTHNVSATAATDNVDTDLEHYCTTSTASVAVTFALSRSGSTWTLTMSWLSTCCATDSLGNGVNGSYPRVPTGGASTSLSATCADPCDGSPLSFTFSSTYTQFACSFGAGPVPGGGGVVAVSP